MEEVSAEKTIVYFVLEVLARAWSWVPFRRHRLDLRVGGPQPPYLMTDHVFREGTNQPVNSRWFRVAVLNRSPSRIAEVSVQLVSVDPPGAVPVVPLPLHLMHDNPPPGRRNLRSFPVEPSGDTPTQFVDVISKIVGQPVIQIEHTVDGVKKLYPAGSYTFVLRISAPNQRSRTRSFSVGLDDDGELTFVES